MDVVHESPVRAEVDAPALPDTDAVTDRVTRRRGPTVMRRATLAEDWAELWDAPRVPS